MSEKEESCEECKQLKDWCKAFSFVIAELDKEIAECESKEEKQVTMVGSFDEHFVKLFGIEEHKTSYDSLKSCQEVREIREFILQLFNESLPEHTRELRDSIIESLRKW